MKKTAINLLLILGTSVMFSQSFQWAKRGGSTDAMPTSSRREEVINIVTDSNKNIYILSAVGKSNLEVDGHPKTNFGDTNTVVDYMVASFACDGTYRWSKVFGGGGREKIYMQIDAQNNIYVAGMFSNCQDNGFPPRIDDDLIIIQNPQDCRMLFISKFNSDGVMQWIKRPQQTGVTYYDSMSHTTTRGLEIDNDGNCYWLVTIPPGTYCDGAFVNSLVGDNLYVFKYNSSGVFQNATLMDMQLQYGAAVSLKLYRNPATGNYVFTGSRSDTSVDTAVFGGQTVTHTVFMASLNAQGQFLWLRENTSLDWGWLKLHGLVFDAANNIYILGSMSGGYIPADSFLGFTVPTTIFNGSCSFIMKVSPTADTLLWSANSSMDSSLFGGIALKGNEVACADWGGGTNFTFGNQTLNVNPEGTGTKVILARFNKDTGNGMGLAKIDNNGISQNDYGTALAVDASGDYIVGGNFASQLIVNGNTLSNIGGQSDFFVAKYATEACSPLANEEFHLAKESRLTVAPNPTNSSTVIYYKGGNSSSSLVLVDMLGRTLQTFSLNTPKEALTIDCSHYAVGQYLLLFKENNAIIESTKLLINR